MATVTNPEMMTVAGQWEVIADVDSDGNLQLRVYRFYDEMQGMTDDDPCAVFNVKRDDVSVQL